MISSSLATMQYLVKSMGGAKSVCVKPKVSFPLLSCQLGT